MAENIISDRQLQHQKTQRLWILRLLLFVSLLMLAIFVITAFAMMTSVLWLTSIVFAALVAFLGGNWLTNHVFSPIEMPIITNTAPSPPLQPINEIAPPAPISPVDILSQNNDAFRQLVEDSPNGHIIVVNDRCEFINSAARTFLDLTQMNDDEIFVTALLPENQQAMFRRQLDVLTQSAKKTSVELYHFQNAENINVDIEIMCRAGEYNGQSATYIVLKDITEQKQIETELTNRNRELMIVQSAGMAITSRLDLRYVLNTVTQEMTRLFGVGQCTIFEWHAKENTIVQNAAFGPNGWWDSRGEPEVDRLADYPLTKSVLEEQIPEQMTITQASIDPRERDDMARIGAKSRLLLPMVFQRQALGLVRLEDFSNERIFTYQEITLAKFLASQAASAIENARLFEQAQAEIAVRKRAESELEEERALLAERVKERTMELSKANSELARAARLKDEFLASMSHELRTPLNTILGSSEILQAEVFGELAEQQAKYIANIDESGRHLLSLINDILDLSKIEAGKMEVSIGPVSVQQVSEASLRLVKQLAHKKHLKLKTDFQNSMTTFSADDRRVKQILVNLLSNAIKFTPEGGEVGLTVVDDVTQGVIRFTVWDTGIGITPDDLQRLFQPFVQLDSSLARQHTGTGLGLSLVSKMMELHGGGVSVESEVGVGSRFTVSFPLTTLTEASNRVNVQPVISQSPIASVDHSPDDMPLVLLAEDNEQSIGLFTDYLKLSGYQFSVARTGKEAIIRAREDNPDLILMDVQMPEMDGLEAIRHLRTDEAFLQVPIISMTALAMPGDRERCIEAGANEYLSKPVNLKIMIQTIQKLLQNT